ncbi:MAG: polyhydroxyalkanoate synthesis repressor PhaR [Rhodospirillales bacterium]|jgi:polyhydroxyalkanoate synthesis repressor PhaR
MAKNSGADGDPITIKKYANRRLYNTATSSYVTLDHLCQMVKEGMDFAVFNAKTGDDITRSVLTQIIVEEESKGTGLLPISFLRQLIRFYGDSLQSLIPGYLDHSMRSFTHNQEKMRCYIKETLGGLFPLQQFEEMSKQNAVMFEQAMKAFLPFSSGGENGSRKTKTPAAEPPATDKASGNQLDELRGQLEAMQKQLNRLSSDKS